ncbi:undecaprenyl/decaprenyl-phosphate alpha-N-acetylglucosaminyl 1-phosphate transferase [Streptomyces sp. SDr-06]|uniref:MraY family glycosyltransferase n=1 Tax=Streptomyces sp. SDr-06 TaxID=2267702 RepID=UPI000DE9261D|nr:MraY family glycosyltransferase [Streptomyces sp. SDr-06]RCH64404.1 undecaprenyl/decaprenyl-phosphate alpha-N-acetylglucosaminyl 1-phosphate transferase [Streptomyces sp. SDr-06]
MLHGLAAATAALVLTALLAALVRTLMLRFGRARRGDTTPHLGGIAVALATLGVACAGPLLGVAELGPGVAPLLAAAGAVALLGLIGDLRPLGVRVRLVAEAAAATAVVALAGLSPGAGALAVLWIVFVTNAFQLLDNSDGAMGAVAAVTALGLAVCAIAEGRPGHGLLLSVLAAALTGFLLHNWHPARIHLGDCGALFTGFLLAASAVTVHAGEPGERTTAELFMLTLVVLTDTLLVLVSRRRAGRPLTRGGGDHIAHRLRGLGLTIQGSAVVLGVVSLAGTLIGLQVHDGRVAPVAVLPLALVVPVAVVLLLRVPVYGPAARRRTPHARTPQESATASVDLAGGRG